MTETNSILGYITHAAERAARAETFLEAIFTYVASESYPDKKTILELASMGTYTAPKEPAQEVDDGK